MLNVWACLRTKINLRENVELSVIRNVSGLTTGNSYRTKQIYSMGLSKLGHIRDRDACYDTRLLRSILENVFYSAAGPRNGERRWRNIDCLSFDWVKGDAFSSDLAKGHHICYPEKVWALGFANPAYCTICFPLYYVLLQTYLRLVSWNRSNISLLDFLPW